MDGWEFVGKMVYINQIFLDKYGIKKNKKFLKKLYENENLIDVSKWFDIKENIQRQRDDHMSLDKFLKLINTELIIRLQFASPDPSNIKYCARQSIKNSSRFAWIICPYNSDNFNMISQLFKESFGKNLKDELVPNGLIEYYNNIF